MNRRWSERFNTRARSRLALSAIGEVMRLAEEEGAISLAAGEPCEELYPSKELTASLKRIIASDAQLWSYSNARRGNRELAEWITRWMTRDRLLPKWVTQENVFITSGSQEGLHMLTEAFLEPGDTVMVESPSYPEALLGFRKEGAHMAGIPLLEDGPDIDKMEMLLKNLNVKCFYTGATFQNPTGFSTSDEKKRRILNLARQYDFLIIEDDPYRHLSYGEAPGETYLRMSGDDQRVLYLGSFSKVIAPGLRCAWAVAPTPVMDVMHRLRIIGNLCLPELTQLAVLDYLEHVKMKKRLAEIQDLYRGHRDALVDALNRHAAPEGLEFNRPEGGFFLWGRVNGVEDAEDFARFAIKEGKVAIVPGTGFFPASGQGLDTIRMSFSKVTPEIAEEGASRLGRALRQYAAR
ncbi:MAG: PLP-dependent aminotransferase family protein [Synergistota bacterium]|nr:PLP-dependent aminotransferase family protein [Synergistota bacterium]